MSTVSSSAGRCLTNPPTNILSSLPLTDYKAKHDGKYYDNEKSARQAYEQRCKELGGKYNDKHGYAHKKHWDTVFRVKDGKSWCEDSCDESKKPKDYTGEVSSSVM